MYIWRKMGKIIYREAFSKIYTSLEISKNMKLSNAFVLSKMEVNRKWWKFYFALLNHCDIFAEQFPPLLFRCSILFLWIAMTIYLVEIIEQEKKMVWLVAGETISNVITYRMLNFFTCKIFRLFMLSPVPNK